MTESSPTTTHNRQTDATKPTPNPRAHYGRGIHPSYVLLVVDEEYGSFGDETTAEEAANWWNRYLESGGHPLSDDEKRLGRRDTRLEHGITFRETLGGPGWIPDLWDVFHGGFRIGRYQTECGARRSIGRITSKAQPHRH
ncbi:hypothetical protein ACFWNT_46005 [Streptomyces sp. NPDC058409]|uniref:hypothetical protein n=1 Tax=Streptomyces sp. NPDC058409 TaxID=3346484 RepID=UPI00364BB189